MRAKDIIEEVYDTILSSKAPYHAQVEPLNYNGALADKAKFTKVLFALCEIVDNLAVEIDYLKQKKEGDAAANATGPNPDPAL